MVKGISAINSIAKKGVLGLMLASSVTLGASCPIKNTRAENEPPKTEVMSKEASEALKLNSLQQTQQSVPTVHNKKLDDMFLLFAENEDERKMVQDLINDLYKEYGTYLGGAMIQTQIDYNMFLVFLDGNAEILKRFPYGENRYKDATKYSHSAIDKVKQPIMEWLEPNYSKVFAPVFSSFDHKPAADELITALDNYVQKNEYNLFKGAYFNEYSNPSESFQNKQANNNLDEVQNNSDLIAYKIHRANQMLFSQLLNANGINISNYRDWYNENRIFYSGYMLAASP